jgi:DNA-directed RNA polymerase
VYTGVLQLVKKRIEQDANMGDELARTLLGKIDRKIVKQTVMTSVYGVTRIGARRQISNAMKGRNICREEDEYNAAVYITKQLFLALEEMFLGARGIMKWLGDCAKSIAAHSKPGIYT